MKWKGWKLARRYGPTWAFLYLSLEAIDHGSGAHVFCLGIHVFMTVYVAELAYSLKLITQRGLTDASFSERVKMGVDNYRLSRRYSFDLWRSLKKSLRASILDEPAPAFTREVYPQGILADRDAQPLLPSAKKFDLQLLASAYWPIQGFAHQNGEPFRSENFQKLLGLS